MNTPKTLTALVPAAALTCLTFAPVGAAQGIRVAGPDGAPQLHVPEDTPFRAVERPELAATPSRLPGGILAPPGYQGPVTSFGGAVDIDGDRIIIGAANDVYILDIALGALESNGLFAENTMSYPPNAVFDVAIEGDWAWVRFGAVVDNIQKDGHACWFQWDGSSWVLVTDSAATQGAPGEVVMHDDLAFLTLNDDSAPPGFEFVVLASASSSFAWAQTSLLVGELAVALSVGDDPAGSLCAMTTESTSTGARSVHAFRFDKSSFTFSDLGIVATGTAADGFGDALAVADGLVWVGTPLDDTGAVDGGKLELYFDDGVGGWGYGGVASSTQAGDQLGRKVVIDGDMLVVSERHADLLQYGVGGGLDVGAARVVRHDGLGTWDFTGEIVHANDQDYTTPDNFATSLALDGLTLAAGEVAGGVNWQFLPGTSQFATDLTPALAGFGGVAPSGQSKGLTYEGFPNAFTIEDARPLATTWLIIGLTAITAPFKTGVYYPSPDISLPFLSDVSGEAVLPYVWPDATGPFTLHGQFWVQDADAPAGWASTGGFTMRQD